MIHKIACLLVPFSVDGSSVEYEGVAAEILQRAACGSCTILNNLLTLLFERCTDSLSLTPSSSSICLLLNSYFYYHYTSRIIFLFLAVQLVSAILFITRSLRRNDNADILPFLASNLQQRSGALINLTIRLIGDLPDKKVRSCLADLLSAIRLVSSSLSVE